LLLLLLLLLLMMMMMMVIRSPYTVETGVSFPAHAHTCDYLYSVQYKHRLLLRI